MGLRVFRNKPFNRFAHKVGITDAMLCRAIAEINAGLISAELGGGVIKQRVARPGQGKSGGFRTIILFRAGDRAFFVHGFAKNAQDNLSRDELTALKKLASSLLWCDLRKIERVARDGVFQEVCCE